MCADHIGDLLRPDPQGGQKQAAGQRHPAPHRLALRPETGVSQYQPITGSDQEAADRQNSRAMISEQFGMRIGWHRGAEVTRAGPRTIRPRWPTPPAQCRAGEVAQIPGRTA